MHDPWMERLSEYIDGELEAGESARLRQHLDACSECRAAEAELRAVIAIGRSAPNREPQRDLWAAIEAGIAGITPGAGSDPQDDGGSAPASGSDDLALRRARGQSRRISFSTTQLAAAAVLLMALTGSAVWLIRSPDTERVATGTIMQSAAAPGSSVQTVASGQTLPAAPDDIAELERALDASRDQLDPATVEVVERSLESIDRAIADARAALEADPGNPYLHRQLDNTMQKKADILRKATRVRRGGS